MLTLALALVSALRTPPPTACAQANTPPTSSAAAAKSALRLALADSDDEANAPAVLAAISALEPFCVSRPAHSALLAGDWRMLSRPEWPDCLGRDDHGSSMYTLGRASFNMFRPLDTIVAFEHHQLTNHVGAARSAEPGSYIVDAPLVVRAATASDEQRAQLPAVMPAVMRSFGEWEPSTDSPSKMLICFTGGELRPSRWASVGDETVCQAWVDTFGNSNQERANRRGLRAKLSDALARILFGVRRPLAMKPTDGSLSYSMSRAPRGFLEVLYLDEELRITRGNRGSVVIAERA